MRAIKIIDTETTGLENDAEVIELAQILLSETAPNRWEITDLHQSLYTPSKPLSAEVRAIHHLEMADLPESLPFHEYGAAAFRMFHPEVKTLAAHSAEYDQRMIGSAPGTVQWICTLKCSLRAWPDLPRHTNQVVRYSLQDAGLWPSSFIRYEANPPHRSRADAYVSAHVLMVLLAQHPLERLLQWSAEPRQLVKMPLGKHRGARFDALPLDYLQWAARSDMGEDIKTACRQELTRRAAAQAPKPPGVTTP